MVIHSVRYHGGIGIALMISEQANIHAAVTYRPPIAWFTREESL
jgi:hypothetical protein